MPKKITRFIFYTIVFSIIFNGVIFGFNKLNSALAQDDADKISYPVKELGNCKDRQDCKAYCDKSEHQETCLIFAERNGLMKKQEIDQAKKVLKLTKEGVNTPGSCKNEAECNIYCEDTAHLDECVKFGEQAGLLSPEEVKMIKKTGGVGPGGCKGKKVCDAYCDDEAHLEECINFAEQNGLLSPQEKEMIKRTGGKGPGGCKSKETCDAYCRDEFHFDECIEFGHQNGMMSDEEYEMAKKMGPKMMKEGGPGGCKGKEECDAFCGKPENFETCIEFGHQNGMMSDEEYEMAKKMGPEKMMKGGPGGCKGKEECEAFCNNPQNAEECVKFAVENGMMSQEEADKMKERGFMMPPKDALGPNGEFVGPGGCKTQEECTAFCSQEENKNICMMFGAGPPQGEMGMEGQMGPSSIMPSGMTGPGGCDSPTACMKYCSEHQEECMKFTPPPPSMESSQPPPMPGFESGQPMNGPGGCKTAQECKDYCGSHPEECKEFMPPSEQGEGLPGITPGYQEPGMPPKPPESFMPPEGYKPPEEYQPPPEGYKPPPEEYQLPPGEIKPPEDFTQPVDQMTPLEMQPMQPTQLPQEMAPPPTESAPPPSEESSSPPPPEASLSVKMTQSFVHFVTSAINFLLGR